MMACDDNQITRIMDSIDPYVEAARKLLEHADVEGIRYEEAILKILDQDGFTLEQAKKVLGLIMASLQLLNKGLQEQSEIPGNVPMHG